MATCLMPAPKRATRSRGLLAMAFAAVAGYKVTQTLNFVAPHQGALTASTRDAAALRGRVALAARGGADDEDDDDIDFYSEVDVATLKQGQELEAVVTRIVPFGAFVDFGADNGVEGLVPTSKLQDGRTENVEDVVRVGDTVKCWVVEVKGPRKVTLSMSQRKIFAPQPKVKVDVSKFEPLVDGDFLDGTVVAVQNFGAFVEMPAPEGEGTAQGLVHITQIKDGFTRNVADEVSVGQQVKVKVIGVNADKNQIQLSMKGAPRPKNDVTGFASMTDEEWLEGSVKSLANYGAFVEVAPPSGGLPIQGLVHISQIQDGFLEDPAEVLEVGMDVKVRVIEVDTENGKVGLSMKQKAAAKADEVAA